MSQEFISDFIDSINSDFPSKVFNVSWVEVSNKRLNRNFTKEKNYKPNAGKWLIYIKNEEIDEVWLKVKEATKAGLLGIKSKAATSLYNPHSNSQSEKVICVYTYNFEDKNDVYRVEIAIRDLGIKEALCYKTDDATLQGKYKIKGDVNICIHYSQKVNKS